MDQKVEVEPKSVLNPVFGSFLKFCWAGFGRFPEPACHDGQGQGADASWASGLRPPAPPGPEAGTGVETAWTCPEEGLEKAWRGLGKSLEHAWKGLGNGSSESAGRQWFIA